MFHFEFENGTITFGDEQEHIAARDNKGNLIKTYGSPEDDDQFKKLHEAIKKVKEEKPVICGPEAAAAQVLCINGLQDSVEMVIPFPKDMLAMDDEKKRIWVTNLGEELYKCYKENKLPSETGYTWANSGKKIDLSDYTWFPEGKEPK
jgi:hypothetical protein